MKGPRISLLASFVLLTWAVFGGLFLYFFLANFITVLLRPKYEQPIDSAQEALDRGMIPIVEGYNYVMEHLKASSNPVYRELGYKTWPVPDPLEWRRLLLEDVLDKDTHIVVGLMYEPDKKLGKFHTSKENIEGAATYSVHLMNKQWEYADAYNHHILLIFQV